MKIFCIFLILIIVNLGCTRDSDVPVQALGTGGVTASQLNNRYFICHINATNEFGADLSGMSFFRSITLNPDNSYVLEVDLYSGTSCGTNATEIFSYMQRGTYLTGGILTSPNGATQVVLTTKQSTLSTFASSQIGSLWANYLNLYCPGSSLGLSTTTTTTLQVPAVHCLHNSSPQFSLPTFTALGAVLYDSIILNLGTSPLTITSSPILSIFEFGTGGRYPTSSTVIYTAY